MRLRWSMRSDEGRREVEVLKSRSGAEIAEKGHRRELEQPSTARRRISFWDAEWQEEERWDASNEAEEEKDGRGRRKREKEEGERRSLSSPVCHVSFLEIRKYNLVRRAHHSKEESLNISSTASKRKEPGGGSR